MGYQPRTQSRIGQTPSTAEQGYLYTGPAGSGHFVKMIHNGIEYGMMQALAEGLDILQGASAAHIPAERRYQLGYSGYVQDSGEGRCTLQTASEESVPAPVIAAALFSRFRSRQETSFADKTLSAMRNLFGGHQEPPKSPSK